LFNPVCDANPATTLCWSRASISLAVLPATAQAVTKE
jgi:hypothetical protein